MVFKIAWFAAQMIPNIKAQESTGIRLSVCGIDMKNVLLYDSCNGLG